MLRTQDDLRRAELYDVVHWLTPGMEVLELGGGSGYQASLLDAWGVRVTSIDVQGRDPVPRSFYPVLIYDGRHIPFGDASFDAVFSSNVLEHVIDLATLLPEIQRVLRPGGVAIHIVPSVTWRLWTTIAHYLRLPRVMGSQLWRRGSESVSPSFSLGSARFGARVRRSLLPGPHGEHTTAFSGLYHFSRRRWLRLIDCHDADIVEARGNGMFYTAYLLAPRIMQRHRRAAARILGSTCHVVVMRKRPVTPERSS